MLKRSLSCFSGFRCLADRCPDTCCAGWEIDLDPEILQRYEALEVPLGEEIRAAITEEDGYTFFRCQDGRCPFLTETGLCRLILHSLHQGLPEEDLLSEVCREHPRFHEQYGTLTESCLAISCPEATRLLLESGPVQVLEIRDAAAGEADPELDTALLAQLEQMRSELFAIARSAVSFPERLRRLWCAAAAMQDRIDNPQSTEDFVPPAPQPDRTELRPWLAALLTMEFTDDRLKNLLQRAVEVSGRRYPDFEAAAFPALQAENLLLYFLYRYPLRAVWDEDLLGKVLLAIRSIETITLLAQGSAAWQTPAVALRETAILFSREVEHSDENLNLLYDALWAEFLKETVE